MDETVTKNAWIPYLVASIGIIISIIIWYTMMYLDFNAIYFSHIDQYIGTSVPLSQIYPWIALSIGVCFSSLLAIIIHMMQVAKQQTNRLELINRSLTTQMSQKIVAEESKQKLEIALLQGQKLQAIGTLAGGIAHDFNNILYAIIGYTEMAVDDAPKDTILEKNLQKVLDAAHKGQELVSRILAFSRRQHHEFKPINLNSVIETALALLMPAIPASVTINYKQTPESMVIGNQTLLHQILVNLINNAVDAMDGEGQIDISLQSIDAANVQSLSKTMKPSDAYIIKIHDTGHGMDHTTMERIFEPFYTTKEVGKGTGLGLSMVHSIIQEHNGDIIVDSKLGHGTTFTILLPKHTNR